MSAIQAVLSLAKKIIRVQSYKLQPKGFFQGKLVEGSRRFFNFMRCMNNRPRNLHKLMPKGS